MPDSTIGVPCRVTGAGASTLDPIRGDPANVVTLGLMSQDSQFPEGQDFLAADAMKREILAVALAAVATGRPVWAVVDPPPYNPGGGRPEGLPGCYALSVLAG